MLKDRITVLKRLLIEYGTLVEYMLTKALIGFAQKDKAMLTTIVETYEPKANNFELAIDDACVTTLAQFDPKACDLRTILMIVKMSNDFERICDHAVNIAESALYLIEQPSLNTPIPIIPMGDTVVAMLRNSTNAFLNADASLAKHVCEQDTIVDNFRRDTIKDIVAIMTNDVTTIERCLHVSRITGNLERIADLSTNICEDVIFMVQGRTIKHHHDNGIV